MKKSSTITSSKWSTRFGILIALLVLLQSLSIQPQYVVEDVAAQKEQAEHDMQVGIDDAVPASSNAIDLGFQSFLINEIEFEEIDALFETSADGFSQAIEKVFRVVFRLIISPNAP